MDNTNIVSALMSAVESGDYETASSYMSEDFTFSGPVPEPVSGAAWLDLHKRLKQALPDFSFNTSDIEETESGVKMTVSMTGTHTGDLDLTHLGIPIIKATEKSLVMPKEHPVMTVHEGEVISLHVADVGADGGVRGIVKQLGE
ncbi:MAG: ester cyclase [Fidelibacterota bacterium]